MLAFVLCACVKRHYVVHVFTFSFLAHVDYPVLEKPVSGRENIVDRYRLKDKGRLTFRPYTVSHHEKNFGGTVAHQELLESAAASTNQNPVQKESTHLVEEYDDSITDVRAESYKPAVAAEESTQDSKSIDTTLVETGSRVGAKTATQIGSRLQSIAAWLQGSEQENIQASLSKDAQRVRFEEVDSKVGSNIRCDNNECCGESANYDTCHSPLMQVMEGILNDLSRENGQSQLTKDPEHKDEWLKLTKKMLRNANSQTVPLDKVPFYGALVNIYFGEASDAQLLGFNGRTKVFETTSKFFNICSLCRPYALYSPFHRTNSKV